MRSADLPFQPQAPATAASIAATQSGSVITPVVTVGNLQNAAEVSGQNSVSGAQTAVAVDAGGRLLNAQDDNISQILVELRLMNLLLAQAFGISDDLEAMRSQPEMIGL